MARSPREVRATVPDADGLFSRDVVVRTGAVVDVVGELHDAERAAIARAIAKRQHEFGTGRKLAREVLSQLGAPGFTLLADADRAPLWPAGIVGSISHSHGLCVVAAAKRGAIVALGIDVEEADGVRPDLWRRVLDTREEKWLRAQPAADQLPLAAVFFSAKEAFYKAQFPLTRARLGFHDVNLELDVERGVFHASTPGFARALAGRFALRSGWAMTGIEIAAGDSPA